MGLVGGENDVFYAKCEYQVETCCFCGCKFALDVEYLAALHNGQGGVGALGSKEADDEADDEGGDGENGAEFCCPNGHQQGYTRRREDVLAEAIVKAKHRAEFAEAETARLEVTVKKLEAERDLLKKKLEGKGRAASRRKVASRAPKRTTGGRKP